ncbi:MAG: redoxin domain-containing protein [Pseudomonadales bacterium]|nr:redoxin domain-containing protein [Pseudomonadales bacterium]
MKVSNSAAGSPVGKVRRVGVALFLGLAVFETAIADPVRVSDFSLLDHEGKFHQLSYYGDQKAVVLVVQASASQWLRDRLPSLKLVQNAWQSRGVQFFMINPTPDASREVVQREAEVHAFGMPVLLDEAQLVAEALQLEQVGDVLVIDPHRLTLLYRGTLGTTTAADLENILSAQTSGQPVETVVEVAADDATAASLTFPGRELGQISYTRDIVPILENNCVSCHHDGGIGPWSMNSHAMVRGFGPMIKEVITTRRMPPGQIDTRVGRPISNAAGLSIVEQQKLIRWIDAGSPIDGETDPLTALSFDNRKFTLGEPDLVYKVPAQQLPASGTVDYRYVPVQLNLDRDVWIRGMEFVPGDHKALHHVIAYLQSPADRRKRSQQSVAARGESVGGFAPGRQADSFGEEGGRLIPKGSSLLLQMHYTTYGKATVDETEFGIYLHDAPPRWVMNEAIAGQRRFLVPPYAKEHKLEGEFQVERDAYLHAMMPHMHYRGKYMNYSAIYPDGSEELLMSVPKYDFNWQFNYQLEEPVLLPAGTRLVARGAMDNSDRNPGNPDPSRPVHFGLQTMHEMFFGFTTLRYVEKKSEDPAQVAMPAAERQSAQGIASK